MQRIIQNSGVLPVQYAKELRPSAPPGQDQWAVRGLPADPSHNATGAVDNEITVHGKPGSVMGLRHLPIRPRRCTMPDHDRPPTVAVVTLGCGRNEVDSENVAGLLSASGFRMVADPERADAVVVNTCAFIQAAKRESIDTILAAADLKEQGRASAVFVTGCLAERYTRELREELPEADAIVPFADYSRLPELLRSRLANGSTPPLAPADSLPPSLLPAERPSPPLKRAGAEPR